MEPTEVARLEGSDRFYAAAELSDRFLDNIESVVHGKRDEIKLVLAALLCGGHPLFEDVPGTAKTVLARAIAASSAGTFRERLSRSLRARSPRRSRARCPRASSARRTCSEQTSRVSRST